MTAALASRLVPLLAALTHLSIILSQSNAFVAPSLSLRNQQFHDEFAIKRAPAAVATTRRQHGTLPAFSTSSTSLLSMKTRIMQASSSFPAIFIQELKALTRFQKAILAATFVLGYLVGKTKPFWKRYTSVMDIPSHMFGENAKVLRGRAVSVSDGDTIRFLHAPVWWSPTSLREGEKTSETALPIRICTIDTPETAKFGKPGQPFGPEAKENLKNLLENKRVNVKLLQRDQYSRGVASVYTGRLFFKKHVDEQMLQDGLAEVYTGGGAVYGPKGKDEYFAMQEEAAEKKVGIWSQKNRESAAEYKKRTK